MARQIITICTCFWDIAITAQGSVKGAGGTCGCWGVPAWGGGACTLLTESSVIGSSTGGTLELGGCCVVGCCTAAI